ncbi:laccase domain-containing protein 1 [Salarias fasciatus]|uniref:Purine nucleoside phosphorylase LACC1 n=1 Tax=Salarias fasciatus TaxID=181472 RepID=A0A672JAD1_SALFA|nr:laccase domain-containing protein 1 [Salarias fasciatus]
MTEAVLVDLLHGCRPGRAAEEQRGSGRHFFLLCGESQPDGPGLEGCLRGSGGSVRLLSGGSTAERLYRFKQAADRLELSSVRVLTSPRGRELLQRYQQLLFTDLYRFDYRVQPESDLTCPSGAGSAHRASPGEGAGPERQGAGSVQEEVQRFVQQLPALRGQISVLKSSLISDCFGHGFSTRTGGVSDVPTLSSMNLFSSGRRRDPVAVVMENRRRLAVHAGFHPRPLRLLKVNHARDVWVLGKEEPERYDAMVTDQTGVVLAAPGADCMPILFTDPVLKVIGVAHAGWKGTLMGVAMETVNAMVTAFGCRASDVEVAVGPSVGVCCFTLDRDEARDFSRIHPDCVPDPESARPHVDIRLANRLLLQEGGVLPEHIHDNATTGRSSVTLCTSCHPQLFFSHVRDGVNFGTQVGFLWIREAAGRSSAELESEPSSL